MPQLSPTATFDELQVWREREHLAEGALYRSHDEKARGALRPVALGDKFVANGGNETSRGSLQLLVLGVSPLWVRPKTSSSRARFARKRHAVVLV